MDNRKTILRYYSIACEVPVNLNFGSKAARDKVHQIAHVRKSRGSLGTTNISANRVWVERVVIFSVESNIPTHLMC